MKVFIAVGLPLLTLFIGWILNEISHRWRAKDEDSRELKRQHRHLQSEALVELQRVALEYYEIAGCSLWMAWKISEEDGKGSIEKAEELHDTLEAKTFEMFAVIARIDDLRIRSWVSYLEEMARQFVSIPGEKFLDTGSHRDISALMEQDNELQRILIQLNNYIGSRLLQLFGINDPETPPYAGE